MMDITNILIVDLLFASNAVLLGAASIALLRFRRQARRFEQFWDSPTGVSLADTQSLEARADEGKDPVLQRKVAELQCVVKTLAKKSKGAPEPAVARLPMDNAVRMAKEGASIDELVRNCGLNIGEAQLLRKVHRKTEVRA